MGLHTWSAWARSAWCMCSARRTKRLLSCIMAGS
jgi:hypothetical protein